MGCCQSVPEGSGKKTPLPPESVQLARTGVTPKTSQVMPHDTNQNEVVSRGLGQGSPNKVLPVNGEHSKEEEINEPNGVTEGNEDGIDLNSPVPQQKKPKVYLKPLPLDKIKTNGSSNVPLKPVPIIGSTGLHGKVIGMMSSQDTLVGGGPNGQQPLM
jgi:hypothetical protein